jgi:hypothetical protein
MTPALWLFYAVVALASGAVGGTIGYARTGEAVQYVRASRRLWPMVGMTHRVICDRLVVQVLGLTVCEVSASHCSAHVLTVALADVVGRPSASIWRSLARRRRLHSASPLAAEQDTVTRRRAPLAVQPRLIEPIQHPSLARW